MAGKALPMLRMSLDSLVNLDKEAAIQVLLKDSEVDRMHREIYDKIKEAITQEQNTRAT